MNIIYDSWIENFDAFRQAFEAMAEKCDKRDYTTSCLLKVLPSFCYLLNNYLLEQKKKFASYGKEDAQMQFCVSVCISELSSLVQKMQEANNVPKEQE